jgi:Flp pilus assembly protein TadD
MTVLVGGGRAQGVADSSSSAVPAVTSAPATTPAPTSTPDQDKVPVVIQPSPASKAPAPKAPAVTHGKNLGAAADTVRQMEIAVEKDTASFDKNYRLGVAYLDRDRSQDAIATFLRCTRLRPSEPKAWVNLGAAEDALGKGADARVAYRKALALNPGDEIALCRLGASHYSTGQKTAAMDTLRVALAQHPHSYCAYFQLGVAFADAGMYKEAIRAWEKVVDYGPGTPESASAQESIQVLREQMLTP